MSSKIKHFAISAVFVTILAVSIVIAFGQNRGTSIAVVLNEWSITMPREIPEGPVTFIVTNQGQFTHNFEIMGDNVDKKFDEDLSPGEKKTMDIDLDAGIYTVICPVGMHAGQGMKLKLTVTRKKQDKEDW